MYTTVGLKRALIVPKGAFSGTRANLMKLQKSESLKQRENVSSPIDMQTHAGNMSDIDLRVNAEMLS